MKRLFIITILLFTTLWIHPIAGFVLAIIFSLFQSRKYFEIILIGILVDVVYGTSLSVGLLQIPTYTLMGFLFFWGSIRIQKRINFHV